MGACTKSRLATGVVVAALLTASCATDPDPKVCGPDPTTRPSEVGESKSAAQWITSDSLGADRFNLFIDVANLQDVSTELDVDVDGQSVLAVRVPGQTDDCLITPVYRYGLVVPAGNVAVVATAASGHQDDMTLEVAESPSWIVVKLQPDFALEMEHLNHAPGWD